MNTISINSLDLDHFGPGLGPNCLWKQKLLRAGLDRIVYWKIIFSLFLNQNICCGYLKRQSQRDERSQLDGSFEHQKHMFKLMGKKTRGPEGPEALTWSP